MAWNNDDWQWVADGPSGGIYQNKYNPSLYANSSGGVGTKEDIMGGGGSGTQVLPEIYTDEDAGQRYQLDTNGRRVYLPKGASGGGGSTNPSTIFINNNPGQLKVQKTVPAGGDSTGLPPGTVYQQDQVTGDYDILYKPPSGGTASYLDPDGNGINDQTGLAVGVIASSKSPSGYMTADGTITRADGFALGGNVYDGGGGSGAPDLVNGKYIWDAKTGRFIVAPGMESTASSSSSGYSSTSSGNSAAQSAALEKIKQAGQLAADAAQRAGRSQELQQQAKINAERDAAQAALQAQAREDEQAFKSGESALDRALRMQESAASNAQRNEDRRLAAVDAFEKGLTSYDAKAYFDALGEAGYDINNLVKGGANLLTDNALTPSAAALGIIRSGGASAASSGLPPVPGGATPPGADLGGTSVPVATSGLPTPPPGGALDPAGMIAANAASRANRLQRQYELEGNRELFDGNVMLGTGIQKTGTGQWYVPDDQRRWVSTPAPSTAAQSGGGQREIDMNLLNDQIARPLETVGEAVPFVQPRAVLPLARGGVASSGLSVVGDSVSGRRTGHEELLIDPTMDSQVIPLNKEGLAAASGLPHYATGSLGTYVPRRRQVEMPESELPVAPTQPVATTGLPPTQPTAPTQPSAPTGITGVPAPNIPTQPVAPTQPAAPAQPVYTGQPGTTQPVASVGLPVTPQPDQALLDEIAQKRRDTILLGGPGMYDLRFGGMSDLYKRTYAENQAQKYGIPAEEILFQAQKNRRGLGGVAASGLSSPLGY